MQFENNKKQRRNIFAQAAARGNEWGGYLPTPHPVPAKDHMASRMRSGSGTSRTTATSDSGEPDNVVTSQLSSSPPQHSAGSIFFGHSLSSYRTPHGSPSNGTTSQALPGSGKGSILSPPSNPASTLSPIANRMRERDADAMEKYLLRSRSGSQGTSSTDTKSQNGSLFASTGPSAEEDDITALISGSVTPRKLRPSVSAAQLRTTQSSGSGKSILQPNTRTGSSTIATTSTTRGCVSPIPFLTRSSSMTKSLRSIASVDRLFFDETEEYLRTPNLQARFPSPPPPTIVKGENVSNGRRKGFHILSKPLQTSTGSNHRRKTSATSTRGS